MSTLLDVVSVHATRDYQLYLEFENGEKKMFDMTYLMDKRPFVRLRGSPLFLAARVDYGTVCWPGNIDIAPETLYDRSVPLIGDIPVISASRAGTSTCAFKRRNAFNGDSGHT